MKRSGEPSGMQLKRIRMMKLLNRMRNLKLLIRMRNLTFWMQGFSVMNKIDVYSNLFILLKFTLFVSSFSDLLFLVVAMPA